MWGSGNLCLKAGKEEHNLETGIYIFTGHYGSGKTETAINFAQKLAAEPARKVAVIDLDIVNPFFRTADAKEELEAAGIRVELPLYANTNVDVPALTGVMGAVIEDPAYDVILDVGGDDLGAKAVGRYSEEIRRRRYTQFFVMNARRPFTKDLPSAAKIYDEVQAASAVTCGGIINNTNLLDLTDADTVIEGLKLIRELAACKGVPILYHCAVDRVADELKKRDPADFAEERLIRITRQVKRLF